MQDGRSFRHATLFYAGDEGFLEGTLPFIGGALDACEPILVAVGKRRIGLLKDALGGDAEAVQFADMHVLGGNPARIIPAWRRFLQDHAPDGRAVRGIGEPIWPGRRRSELNECERHEALLNLAFDGGQPWQLLCPYDLEHLEEEVIAGARCNHPLIAEGGRGRSSPHYARRAPSTLAGALPPPSGPVEQCSFGPEDLPGMRSRLAGWAESMLLAPERIEGLVLSASELAANSIHYGGGGGTLSWWREGERLLCEVHDGGHLTDPLVGRIRPTHDVPSGRGLWLANQLCDLVQIRSGPAGTTVRLHMQCA